ncbi:hypothetical protein B0H13DRAFT_2359901 [Mycena leptocephala]|nr:hypothetical protein B0H13DRAFT_2359901 [Mycena leptocephala]
MFRKASLLSAIRLFIAGAGALVVSVDQIQLCNLSGKDVAGGIKRDVSGNTADLCGDYSGTPVFGPAHVDCDGGGSITGSSRPMLAITLSRTQTSSLARVVFFSSTAFKAPLESGKVPMLSWADHICLGAYTISV